MFQSYVELMIERHLTEAALKLSKNGYKYDFNRFTPEIY